MPKEPFEHTLECEYRAIRLREAHTINAEAGQRTRRLRESRKWEVDALAQLRDGIDVCDWELTQSQREELPKAVLDFLDVACLLLVPNRKDRTEEELALRKTRVYRRRGDVYVNARLTGTMLAGPLASTLAASGVG